MRRTVFFFCLALSFAGGAVRQADASPLMLSIWGYADNVPVNYVTDVSNGFSGATISLTTVPFWTGSATGSQGGDVGINSSINLTATLYNSTQNLASLALTGQIYGGIASPSIYSIDPSGGVRGSATPGSVYLYSGVDPSTIPAWFSTLGAGVSGDVTGGAQAYLPITLGIGPGDTPAAQVQPTPVPEPASVAIFLACAVAGVYLRTTNREA